MMVYVIPDIPDSGNPSNGFMVIPHEWIGDHPQFFRVYSPTVDHGATAFSPSKNEVKITGRYQPLSTQ